MTPSFLPEVHEAAARHDLSPATAFGLGEGLNLFYSRRLDAIPPHRLHVLPSAFTERVVARATMPRVSAIREALLGNALGVLVCTGDWHGLDAIEKWAEELPRWPTHEGWRESLVTFADMIDQGGGLYRGSYLPFLDEAEAALGGLVPARALLEEVAEGWLGIGASMRRGDDLERTARRLLRQAALESRFWGTVHQRVSSAET